MFELNDYQFKTSRHQNENAEKLLSTEQQVKTPEKNK